MAFCTECGSKLPEDAVFCPNCGTAVKPPVVSGPTAPCNPAPNRAEEENAFVPDAEAKPEENGGTGVEAQQSEAGQGNAEAESDSVFSQSAGRYEAPAQGAYTSPDYSAAVQGSYTSPEHPAPAQGAYTSPEHSASTQGTYTSPDYSAPAQGTYSSDERSDFVPSGQNIYPNQPQQYNAANSCGYPPYQGGPSGAKAPSSKISKGAIIAISVSVAVVLLAVIAILVFKPFSSPYVGYWETTAVDVGDGVISQDYYGISVVGALGIQINSDDSAYLASAGSTEIFEGTWQKSKNGIIIDTDDDVYAFYYKDEQLILVDSGETYYFDKIKGHDINNPTVPHGSYASSYSADDGFSADTGTAGNGSQSAVNIAGSGYIGNSSYYITVTGAEEFTDVDNEPAIRIYYDFTNYNLSSLSASAWDELEYYAMQDGSYLSETYSYDNSAADNLSYYIRPGLTIQCCSEFKYDPYGGSVDFSVCDYYDGESGGIVSASYLPDSLPGAPAPYVIVPVSDPQWTLNLPGDGYLGDYYIAVNDAELVDDANGDPAIRVYYDFTNNGSFSASMCDVLIPYAYQDGVSLYYAYAAEDSEADSNYYTQIDPGSSITCSCLFSLRNQMSPVEAEVEGFIDDISGVGQTYDISG